MIDVEFDDRKYTGSHYGHLCRAQVRLTGVTLIDERDGSMNERHLRDEEGPGEEGRGRQAARRPQRHVSRPSSKPGKWYTLVVETVGDEMRVTIDGKPAGYLKSSGIGHADQVEDRARRRRARTAASTTSRCGTPSRRSGESADCAATGMEYSATADTSIRSRRMSPTFQALGIDRLDLEQRLELDHGSGTASLKRPRRLLSRKSSGKRSIAMGRP